MGRKLGVKRKSPKQQLKEAKRELRKEAARKEHRAMCELFAGAGLPTPDREHAFHDERKWRMDYAWPDLKIAVEKEGGVYGRGRQCKCCGQRRPGAHSSVTGILRDIEKYTEASVVGWIIVRRTPEDLITEATLDLVQRAIELRENGKTTTTQLGK